MHKPLLDSSVSVPFSLGSCEQFMPHEPDLEGRIIRFRTNTDQVDFSNFRDFLNGYDHLADVEKKQTHAVAEFFLERFFEQLASRALFDVCYVESPHGTIYNKGKYCYEFVDHGRTIKVYTPDKSQVVTEISRLVEIKKGGARQYVLCDPHITSSYGTRLSRKIDAAKDLIGRDVTLSYMLAYLSDIFKRELSLAAREKGKSHSSQNVVNYLKFSSTNLVLVYSGTTLFFKELGQMAHSLMSQQ